MQSMASLMSDVAAVGDFDDEDDSINNGNALFRSKAVHLSLWKTVLC